MLQCEGPLVATFSHGGPKHMSGSCLLIVHLWLLGRTSKAYSVVGTHYRWSDFHFLMNVYCIYKKFSCWLLILLQLWPLECKGWWWGHQNGHCHELSEFNSLNLQHTMSPFLSAACWHMVKSLIYSSITICQRIVSFLHKYKHTWVTNSLEQMWCEQFMAEVYFLCDFFGHLNTLNLKVQGQKKFVTD